MPDHSPDKGGLWRHHPRSPAYVAHTKELRRNVSGTRGNVVALRQKKRKKGEEKKTESQGKKQKNVSVAVEKEAENL